MKRKPEIDFKKLAELKELLENAGAVHYIGTENKPIPDASLTDPYYQRRRGLIDPKDFEVWDD